MTFRRLRSRVHRAGHAAFRQAAVRLGYDVVWRDYYSPIPDLRRLQPAVWTEPGPMPGVAMDLAAQLAWLEGLAPYLADFRPPEHSPGPHVYGRDSGFELVDAAVLHATVRRLRPARIIELGAGASTLVTAAACRQLAESGHAVSFTTCDPYPRDILQPPPAGVTTLLAQSARDLSLERFRELGVDDILFIDTTHTVKVGSEVNHLLQNVLPVLSPGVVVHFHDIFLPWEYPRAWVQDNAWFWSEQYLLQAFLIHNPCWEILLGNHLVQRSQPEMIQRLIGGPADGASFWMRRIA
jgi:hypothetical protein